MYDFVINSALDMFLSITLGMNLNSNDKLNLNDKFKEFVNVNYN